MSAVYEIFCSFCIKRRTGKATEEKWKFFGRLGYNYYRSQNYHNLLNTWGFTVINSSVFRTAFGRVKALPCQSLF